jgi:hypothetical protein
MTYRYRFISEHRASYGVKRLCRVLAVRRQGFYEWVVAGWWTCRPARVGRCGGRRRTRRRSAGVQDLKDAAVVQRAPDQFPFAVSGAEASGEAQTLLVEGFHGGVRRAGGCERSRHAGCPSSANSV